MSIHSDLMRSGAGVLFAVQGDAGAVLYQQDGKPSFPWPSASVGAERGGIEESEAGGLLKVSRMLVAGLTAELVANGVTELERTGTVTIAGKAWAIDILESAWGPTMVRLGLIRRPIAREQEMESRDGTLR